MQTHQPWKSVLTIFLASALFAWPSLAPFGQVAGIAELDGAFPLGAGRGDAASRSGP